MDTIYALATVPGKSGVAIVRVSGKRALDVGRRIAGTLPAHRGTRLCRLTDSSGEHLDDALVLRFDAPHSFTGEDVVEFHLHGSQAIIAAVMRCTGETSEVRPAEAGEFTRRALENDRLDLTQVEGLADLIDAETESQRRQALKIFAGGFAERVDEWRTDLIKAAALVEAMIDFAEEDIPDDLPGRVHGLAVGVLESLKAERAGALSAERVRSGFEVAIIGAPNVGKSSLLNRLAKREAAITSEIAGTTRDIVEVRMDLDGIAVTLLDTAGLRDTADPIEMLGVSRAVERAEAADLRVFIHVGKMNLPVSARSDDIVVAGKVDLNPSIRGISSVSGEGIADLLREIHDILSERSAGASLATRDRHRVALNDSIGQIERALGLMSSMAECPELIAEDLRAAIRALETIIGRVDVEDLLDDIFSSFCIGK